MEKQTTMIKSMDELPAVLQASHIGQVLGLSRPLVYDLLNSEGFPTVRIGSKRLVVAKDGFVRWLNEQSNK